MLPDNSLPDVGADRRGLAELLDGAGLQDRYHRVLWLRYGDGLTLRQTAAALQVCAQRAGQIERAALQHLRERLERPRYAKGRSA